MRFAKTFSAVLAALLLAPASIWAQDAAPAAPPPTPKAPIPYTTLKPKPRPAPAAKSAKAEPS